MVELIGGDATKSGSGVVESGYGLTLLVCLQKKALGWTRPQALCMMPKAETHIKTMRQELTQLLGFSSEAVENPGLRGAPFQKKNIVDGTDTVEYQGPAAGFAQLDLRLEDSKLKVIGGSTEAVEATLTDEERGEGNGNRILRTTVFLQGLMNRLLHLQELRLPILSNKPGMKAKGRNGHLLFAEGRMGMKIQEGLHGNALGEVSQ